MYGEETASTSSGGESDDEYLSGSDTADDSPIAQDSILFPKYLEQPPRTAPVSTLPPAVSPRSKQINESDDESAAHVYGEQEDRQFNIGGSRPSSRLSALSPVESPLVSPIPSASGLGYLYLHDSAQHESALPQLKNLDARKARLGVRSSTASRFNSLRGSVFEVASPRQSYSQVASIYGNYAEQEGAVEERIIQFNAEESWVILRVLVGEELTKECGSLWKLSSTDRLELDRKASIEGANFTSNDIPILRFLIKDFLLKLPIIKHDQPGSLVPFWVDGLLPLIKAYHDADLSHSIDQGSASLTTILGGKLKTTVERFVSNAIRISCAEQSEREEAQEEEQEVIRGNPVVQRAPRTTAAAPRIATLPPADPIFRRFSLAGLFARTKSPATNSDGFSPALDSSPFQAKEEPARNGRNSFDTVTNGRRDWIDESESSSLAEEREVLASDGEDEDEVARTMHRESRTALSPPESDNGVDPSVSEYDDDDDTSAIAQDTEGEKTSKSRHEILRPTKQASVSDIPVSDEPASSRRIPSTSTRASSSTPTRVLGNISTYESSPQLFSNPLTDNRIAVRGTPWPWDEPVAFWRGMPLHQLKWGGFEADVVAVRRTIFGHAFVIRIRRPKKLDEIVIRTEAQFSKYYKRLEKAYPDAHLRPIPSTPGEKDDAIPASPVDPFLRRAASVNRPSAAADEMETLNLDSRTPSRQSQAVSTAASGTTLQKTKSGRFATELRAQSSLGESRATLTNVGNAEERVSPVEPVKAGSASHDSRRRALRSWLRDTLSIHSVGHDDETAAFLLLGSIVPKKQDTKDIVRRALIDERRKTARVAVAQSASDRAKELYDIWTSVKNDCCNGIGFSAMSEALRTVDDSTKLPERYVKSIDWIRFGLAESLFDILVVDEGASALFSKIKSLHAAFPWFLARQVMKIGNPEMMMNRLQDLLLARPFGNKSLLQKIIATVLDDEPEKLQREIDSYRARIGSAVACQKIDLFVNGDREQRNTIRRFAETHNLELAICIVRGADAPRLSAFELDRVIVAESDARKFLKTNPSSAEKAAARSTNVRYYFDLTAYLRLTSRQRDAAAIRKLLGDDATTDALQAFAVPLIDLLKRIYKVGQLSNGLVELQQFLDQLIVVVESVRARIQNPDNGIRILSRLLARYQQPFYSFLQKVYRGDSIIEELLRWFSMIATLQQRGLSGAINLDNIVPSNPQEKSAFLDELEDLIGFRREKRSHQYQNLCRKFAGDIDGDDPIIVEGDGKGRSRVEPLFDSAPPAPRLTEIPRFSAGFRSQLHGLFSV